MVRLRISRLESEGLANSCRLGLATAALVGTAAPLLGASRFLPRRDVHRLSRAWARSARALLGIQLEIRGEDHVEPSRTYVVTPLHEGFADALALAALPLDLRFVARDELFGWPILGRALRATDQLMIRPEGRVAGLRRLIVEAKRSFSRGESIVMFPQGSIIGIEAAFRTGPFRLADELGVPVLPVVITGTHTVWEHPYSPQVRFGQRVSMSVLAPLEPGTASDAMPGLQREMKRVALGPDMATGSPLRPGPRRLLGRLCLEIDPDYPHLASRVDQHRRG